MSRLTPTLLASLVVLSSAGVVALVPSAAAQHASTDLRIRSFDNTFLDATLFLPDGATANSTPFVLMTHGWAGSRVTTPTGRVLDLLNAGYGVLTWDSRGFGASGGEVELDSPDYEVKDVQALVSYVARFVPQAKLQARGDPLVGMSGGSYAGGIQLLAAAFDPRIDAIAPEITWNDLTQALGPNGVPKLAWTSALFGAGLATSCSDGSGREFAPVTVTTGCQTSDLARYYAMVHATNSIPDEVREAFEYRSPKNYNQFVDVPTLIIQGFPDTLFDVNQAAANYAQIKANGAPVKLWLYDGGHALPGSTVPNTQAGLISPTVVKWFDRHLKGDTGVDTGPEVEYYLGGAWRSASAWPVPEATAQSTFLGGIAPLTQSVIGGGPTTSTSVRVANGPLASSGPMHIAFRVGGLETEATVYASLGVQTGTTVTRADGQVQPIRFAVDPSGFVAVETDLVQVTADVPAGSSLVLVFTSFERDYDNNRVPGFVNINNLRLDWSTL